MLTEQLQLVGTENLLTNLTKEEKNIFIQSINTIKRPCEIVPNNRKFLDRLRNDLFKRYLIQSGDLNKSGYEVTEYLNKRYSKAKRVSIVNELITFYINNVPDGFKKIPDTYDYVNQNGIIIRWNRLLANYSVTKNGYLHYSSRMVRGCVQKVYSVHRAVALTFISNPENKATVNHIDGDKLNNCVDNLEWNTISENSQHAWATGLITKYTLKGVGKGEANSQSKLTMEDVICIRKTLHDNHEMLVKECAELYNTTPDTIVDKVVINTLEDLMVLRDIKTNGKTSTFYTKTVRAYKGTPQQHINSILSKGTRKCRKVLMEKYNISTSTLSDIMSRNSWDYENC